MVKTIYTKFMRRVLLIYKHYQFKTKLEYKSSCMEKSIVKVVDESFTSKTCGNCGYIKKDLKNAEIYNCNKCHLEIDRDINGVRNIMLKNLNQVVIAKQT